MNNTEADPFASWPDGDLFPWRITEAIVYLVVICVGIVGNLFVFYINHFRFLSTTDTLFKRILAFFDLIGLTMFVPLALYLTFVPDTPYYNNCCKYLSFFALWSLSTGGNFLVVIAMDRFLKLCLLRKSGIEPAIVKKIIFGLALYTGLLNIPVTLLFTRDETPMVFYQVKAVYCFLDLRTDLVILMEFFSYYSMVSISGVALTLIILYGKIILKLRELSLKHKELKGKTAGASEEAAKGNRQSRAMLKSSLVFIAVTAAYFGCFTPYGVVVIMENVRFLQAHQLSPLTKALYDLCKLSPTLTHMLNPLIFIFSSDRFMAEVKAIVLCRSSFRYCCVRRQNV